MIRPILGLLILYIASILFSYTSYHQLKNFVPNRTSSNVLFNLLGSAKAVVGDIAFEKADLYYHGGGAYNPLQEVLGEEGMGDAGHSHSGHEHQHDDHGHDHHSHDAHDHSHDAHDHSHDAHDHSHDAHDHSHDAHDHSHDAHDHSHDAHDHSHDAHDHSHDAHDHSHYQRDEEFDKDDTMGFGKEPESRIVNNWIRDINMQLKSRPHAHLTGDQEVEVLPFIYVASSLNPHHIDAILVESYWVGVRFGRHQEAVERLEAAIQNNPYEWRLDEALASLYYKQIENYDLASKYFQSSANKAILNELDLFDQKRLALNLFRLGKCYEITHKYEQAIKAYTQSYLMFGKFNEEKKIKQISKNKIAELQQKVGNK